MSSKSNLYVVMVRTLNLVLLILMVFQFGIPLGKLYSSNQTLEERISQSEDKKKYLSTISLNKTLIIEYKEDISLKERVVSELENFKQEGIMLEQLQSNSESEGKLLKANVSLSCSGKLSKLLELLAHFESNDLQKNLVSVSLKKKELQSSLILSLLFEKTTHEN